MVLIDLFGGLCLVWLASFPGLPPTFFVLRFFALFCFRVLYRTKPKNRKKKEKKKRGRPGNKASVVLGSLVAFAVLLSVA